MNTVILSGRLTKKPELRSTVSGGNVCPFSLAIQRDRERVDFIECVCFGKTAENLAKYQDKGSQIELTGRLENNSYTDKDGKNHSKTVVSVGMINYISSPQTSVRTRENDEKDPYKEMGSKINSELPF